MQDETSIKLVVEDLFKQLKAENVIYVEIRFAPLLHCRGELSADDVVEIVNNISKNVQINMIFIMVSYYVL